MVTGANTGMNPFRHSHFNTVDAWTKAGYPQPDLGAYLTAMKKSDLDPNAVQDLRMPGAAQFQDATEVGTGKAVSGQSNAQAALDGVASTWKQINDQKGHDKQLAAYKASLNLGATR
jgi:multiple sugar transport system substrate-binding protein